jgi:Zn-dependent dipeptidase, microsomal dipeptidase homolog
MTRAVPAIDGMAFAFGGWSDDLAASRLSAIIVTVDDFRSGYDVTRERMDAALATIDADPRMALVRETADIERARQDGRVGIILGFQNSNPFEGDVERLREFAALGLRCAQLTYNETNLVGSGCLAPEDEGLTAFGRELVVAMNELGVLVDLSHCGDRTSLDAVETTTRPVAITHASLRAVTPNPRNKTDEVVRAVAGTGGLIGLSAYGPFCWDAASRRRPTLRNLLAHVRHAVDLVGDTAVGFGGDWPVGVAPETYAQASATLAANAGPVIGDYNDAVGSSPSLRYPSDMPTLGDAWRVGEALAAEGYGPETVDRLMGGNFLRVLDAAWAA